MPSALGYSVSQHGRDHLGAVRFADLQGRAAMDFVIRNDVAGCGGRFLE